MFSLVMPTCPTAVYHMHDGGDDAWRETFDGGLGGAGMQG